MTSTSKDMLAVSGIRPRGFVPELAQNRPSSLRLHLWRVPKGEMVSSDAGHRISSISPPDYHAKREAEVIHYDRNLLLDWEL